MPAGARTAAPRTLSAMTAPQTINPSPVTTYVYSRSEDIPAHWLRRRVVTFRSMKAPSPAARLERIDSVVEALRSVLHRARYRRTD